MSNSNPYGFQIPGAPPVAAPPAPMAPPPGFSPPYAPPAAPPGYTPPGFAPPPYAPPGAAPPPAFAPPAPYAPPPNYAPPPPPVPMPAPAHPVLGNAFDGMNQGQAFSKGSYFNAEDNAEGPGSYLCRINEMLVKNTQRSGVAVIVELEVVGSTNPKVAVGVKRGWVQTLKDRSIAFANLIEFLAAVSGLDANDSQQLVIINTQLAPQSQGMLEDACKNKTLNGRFVVVTTSIHVTKKSQRVTRYVFSPAPKA